MVFRQSTLALLFTPALAVKPVRHRQKSVNDKQAELFQVRLNGLFRTMTAIAVVFSLSFTVFGFASPNDKEVIYTVVFIASVAFIYADKYWKSY